MPGYNLFIAFPGRSWFNKKLPIIIEDGPGRVKGKV